MRDSNLNKNVVPVGGEITFTTPSGETKTGRVECRNWFFDRLSGYVVTTPIPGSFTRHRWHVNATSLTSGHCVFN